PRSRAVSEEASGRVRARDRGRAGPGAGEDEEEGARPGGDQQPAHTGVGVRLGPERRDPDRRGWEARGARASTEAGGGARDPVARGGGPQGLSLLGGGAVEEARGELRAIVREARVLMSRAASLGAVPRAMAPVPAIQPAPTSN